MRRKGLMLICPGMKRFAGPVVVLLLLVIWLGVRFRQKRSPPVLSPDEGYVGLRNLALHESRASADVPAASKPTEPYGVLMDRVISTDPDIVVATIVAMRNGDASIYVSKGGGLLGFARSHESIRTAAKEAVKVAGEVQPLMQSTTTYPLPTERGQVIFYVLTDAGIFTAGVSNDDLQNHRGPFSKLGDAFLTTIDLITSADRKQGK